MRPCPNCQQPVAADRTVCPNCGANLATVWPPPPSGQLGVPTPPPEKLITGQVAGDVALGLAVGLVLLGVGIGLLLTPILWAILKPRRPAFARGLGWAAVASYALLLGGLAMCFYGFAHEGQ